MQEEAVVDSDSSRIDDENSTSSIARIKEDVPESYVFIVNSVVLCFNFIEATTLLRFCCVKFL
jgi:hypothetical protein